MKLKARDEYLNKLISFKDTEFIKVITGIRRCGKSSLLKLMQNYLLNNGIDKAQIISMNFEYFKYRNMNVEELYEYVKGRIIKNKKMYLFFDEIQRIKAWEDAINSFRLEFNCDIYITGSNAYLLSSEYTTYLSGRCVEINMLPLSFKEFLEFNDIEIKYENRLGINRLVLNSDKNISLYEAYNSYITYGGMPSIYSENVDFENAYRILDNIFVTIIEKDLRFRRNLDEITLTRILRFLIDNIGSTVSSQNIARVLLNENILNDKKMSVHTIQSYIQSILSAYIMYDIKRYDIKGKQLLKTLGKYYVVDIGLRNLILGNSDKDRGHILENIVYFELLKKSYEVFVGKIDDKEIDFIATKLNEKKYIQVSETLINEETKKREIAPLLKIPDNYEKMILTLDDNGDYEGIKIKNVLEWLVQ